MLTVRVFVVLMLWLLQAALVVLLVHSDWLRSEVEAERSAIAEHLGQGRYAHLAAAVDATYQLWFVNTGVEAASYQKLLPEHSAQDLKLAPWFFAWLERRLDALWSLLHHSFYRLALLREWGVYFALICSAAVVDGLIQRQIKRRNLEPPSADRYTAARYALLILIFAPLVYMSIPLSVPPVTVPLWGCAVALSLLLLISNAQHRV